MCVLGTSPHEAIDIALLGVVVSVVSFLSKVAMHTLRKGKGEQRNTTPMTIMYLVFVAFPFPS